MTHEVTRDALLGGRVRYTQPAHGYRVALEAPLLARFAIGDRTRGFGHIIDLGAGPGAIGLMLAVTGWAATVTAVELDIDHAALAWDNAQANGVEARVRVLQASVDDAIVRREGGAAELVVSNPPWFDPDAGAIATGESRANARALRGASLEAFVRGARGLLGRNGRFVVSFPSARLAVLLDALSSVGLVAKRARFVHSRANADAQVVFVEAKAARAGGLVIEAPLIVRGAGEAYERATEDTLWGRWPQPVARPSGS